MIDTTTFAVSGKAERPLVHQAVVAADPVTVFDMLTTSDGVAAFLGVRSVIELKIGGRYELFFGEDLPEGERGSEGCRILSYVPGEMLSFSWNSPPTLPMIRNNNTWVVMTFADHPSGTRVRLVHTGMPSGGDWETNREYFNAAWPSVLAALTQHFEPTPTDRETL